MKTAAASKGKRAKASKIWIPIVVVVILVAGGLGYYYWNQASSKTQVAATSSTSNTSQVRKGSIMISVSGSGTLTASQENNLAFSTSGTVSKVNAAVGDK